MSFLEIKSANVFKSAMTTRKNNTKITQSYQPMYHGFPCMFASLSDMLKTS